MCNRFCLFGIVRSHGEINWNLSSCIRFTGSAGQSFACFLTPGMNIRLVGEANDYVGKVTAGLNSRILV